MGALRKQKGFTLVELLVVLAIIGILIGLAVMGIKIVQQVNRDTQRKALSRDIQLVLESYNEKHNHYPATLTLTPSGDLMEIRACSSCGAGGDTEEGASKVVFTVDAVTTSGCTYPADPWSGASEPDSGTVSYCYGGGGRSFVLYMQVERNSKPYYSGNE